VIVIDLISRMNIVEERNRAQVLLRPAEFIDNMLSKIITQVSHVFSFIA